MKRPLRPAAVLICSYFSLLSACQTERQFKLLSADDTNIRFANALTIEDSLNILDNEFIYNGAGVAIGDWNGDNLQDIFFTANMEDNALYLNKGQMKFEEVTQKAGLNKPHKCWSAGATVTDINADGKLDLYVSNMMYGSADMRRNFLYINQGNDTMGVPRFKEMAAEYGLSPDTYSAQTTFFDYDNDGDLDAYILVNFMDVVMANQYLSPKARENSPTVDHLLRNDFNDSLGHPVFTDVSQQAGITAQGYGHAVSLGDFNKDGWIDLYVTNDFLSNDNLYLNKGDGTFEDAAPKSLKHQSWSAMGNDVADFNNDGRLDLIAMDMLPDFNERKKALIRANSYNHILFTEQFDYSYQYIRNTLQVSRGNDPQTGIPLFSEIGQLAGIQETDWSWCPLWMDVDNDGLRDLLVTNGFPRDITDQDFLNYRKEVQSIALSKGELYKTIPEVKNPNYLFRNEGNLQFKNKAFDWGLKLPTFSNGAAYADLDNDGDLDLIINNINDLAHVYQNTQNDNGAAQTHFLRLKLEGTAFNPMGLGTKVEVFAGKDFWYAEQSIVRGYLSASEPIIHFGLGAAAQIDSLRITWPDRGVQIITHPKLNQVLTVKYAADLPKPEMKPAPLPLFTTLNSKALGISYQHSEGDYVDFNIQKTLPHKFSQYGPGIAVGDMDGNGLDDFYLGGSSRVEGSFFLQQPNGTFTQTQQKLKQELTRKEEDLGILFFDADSDGDLDLYCTRGSYQHEANDPAYRDALFINDGKGNFRWDSLALPKETACGQVVKAADYDHDGDLDLFVGGRVTPKMYPKAERSFILRNDSPLPPNGGIKENSYRESTAISERPHGLGRFTDVTRQIAPQLEYAGLISDALWTDYDNDGWADLLLAGEWMPLTFFKNQKGKTFDILHSSLDAQKGWWTSLCGADFDNDGDTDYIAGNYGLNLAYKASDAEPLHILAKDFDSNGTYDAFIGHYDNNTAGQRRLYPFATRDDAIKQSLLFRRKFLKYADYGAATWDRLFTAAEAEGAVTAQVNQLQSCYVENLGKGQFRLTPLPIEAQFAPIFGMQPLDADQDGLLDAVLIGNDYGMELFQGRADAFYGLVLKNTGQGNFKALSLTESGFLVSGDARALTRILLGNKKEVWMATQNRAPLCLFELKNAPVQFVRLQPEEHTALLTFSNGKKRRWEFYYGSGFLSQNSRTISIPKNAKSLELFSVKGRSRTLTFAEKTDL
ncbi:MAG: VCBS repeat-containing protein [Spirosomataceae bacterium]